MSEQLGTSSEWARKLTDYYAQGYSDAEVAAELKITIKDFNKHLAENAGFSKLVNFGRTLSTAFWEGLARKNIANKQFNTPLYNFYMKNKYGWADKIETNNSNDNTNMNMDALKAELARKLKKLADDNSFDIAEAQRVLQPVDEKVND